MKCEHCGNEEWARMMGHELQGVYDGTLVWQCLVCGFAWARDCGDMEYRQKAADKLADSLNVVTGHSS